jgi:hypothetical protein
MHETTVQLIRKNRHYVAEPLGWRVHDVIGPLQRRMWERPWALLCSSDGVIAVRRTWRDAVVGSDDLLTFDFAMEGTGIAYPRKEIAAITVRRRYFKNDIRLSLSNGTQARFYVFARGETDRYRALLQRTYAPLYAETGFDSWWKK